MFNRKRQPKKREAFSCDCQAEVSRLKVEELRKLREKIHREIAMREKAAASRIPVPVRITAGFHRGKFFGC